jgi:hypothetical protein
MPGLGQGPGNPGIWKIKESCFLDTPDKPGYDNEVYRFEAHLHCPNILSDHFCYKRQINVNKKNRAFVRIL